MAGIQQAKAFCLSPELEELVHHLNFKQVNPRDVDNKTALTAGMAPCFFAPRTKMSKIVSSIPEDVQVMLVAALKKLPETPTWENVLSAFQNNPFLQRELSDEVIRSDQVLMSSSSFLNFKLHSQKPGVATTEIHAAVAKWYNSLVGDDDVLKAISLDIDAVADLVAQTADAGLDLRKIIFEEEGYARPLLDVSGLLFPDADHPQIKLFRLRLTLTGKFDRIIGIQNDQNGLSGEYNAQVFKPSGYIMEVLSPENRAKALEQCSTLFATESDSVA